MNKEQYEAWRAQNNTKAFFDFLNKSREALKERIADDTIDSGDLDKAIQRCVLTKDLIDLDYETYIQELEKAEETNEQ